MPAGPLTHEWLLHILETIDEGIHAVDRDGITILYNRAAGRLDGLAPEDVLGKHVLEAFPSLGHDTSTLLQVLETGRAIRNRAQTYTNYLGFKVHTVNTTLPIVSGGEVVGALEIAKDLTQVKRLSEQVLDLQAQVASGHRRAVTRGAGRDPGSRAPGGAGRAGDAGERPGGAVYQFSHFISQDPRVADIKRRAQRAATTTSPVLVYGETGTGKELLVQAIHNAGPRRGSPFLALNCAALPAPLLEGILFGTVRGSFTGAEDRPGLFELADGGTLFLDEIQSMPLELQAKLLRALQEGEFMRVGDTRVRHVQVRVMAAMNRWPEQEVAEGRLREDLFYRINVVRLDLPPLRDRRGDLPLLVAHFVEKWNGRFGTQVTGVTAEVSRRFAEYPWPGNVRELENAIEAAMNLVTSGDIPMDALPAHLREWCGGQRAGVGERTKPGIGLSPRAGTAAEVRDEAVRDAGAPDARGLDAGVRATPRVPQDAGQGERPDTNWVSSLREAGMDGLWARLDGGTGALAWPAIQAAFERIVLQRALARSGGNVKLAAQRLGIPRQTLQYRLRQLGLAGTRRL
ncbi:sigma-54 interaction domain-containing protein [Alicyclobacillus macrosporangiidus]|uniref:Arginine utilization regulatory protein n=1 Tax=Alicyclobacillus macrosporangiidus TaxID=392015 RepID=A0A1I7HRM9_9BACL|nr:sigma 54-interacting transcriptional regulator [Alicyclobacillus macrosporangiidus]SFU63388.1 arginine utilization regulatory protein [Alicyclobacillus macrosporangiidus]